MAVLNNLNSLAERVQQIHLSDPSRAQDQIEKLLEKELSELPPDERLGVLSSLIQEFDQKTELGPGEVSVDEEMLTKIFHMLLGKGVSSSDLPTSELLNRLSDSLNTIFDSLNQLVSIINKTFLGQDEEIETIRQVIGFHLEGSDHTASMKDYIGQISKAFVVALDAFKIAAEKKMGEVLKELDPARLRDSIDGKFRLGRSRKAESFEIYEDRYKALKKWVESGRYIKDLLREFENNSQRLFLK